MHHDIGEWQILPLLGMVDGEGHPVLSTLLLEALLPAAGAAATAVVEAVHPAIEAMATLLALDEATADHEGQASA